MRLCLSLLLLAACAAPLRAFDRQLAFEVRGGTRVIRNASCSSFVISAGGRVYSVAPRSEVRLRPGKSVKWWWMPGALSDTEEKVVTHPLENNLRVSFGPGYGTHTGPDHYSYDFSVPEGTPVYAMEPGVVISVTDRYDSAHRDKRRMKENNRVLALHADGTVAVYAHLKKDSIAVEECEEVDERSLLGLSGNTGYSLGPHLHVDVSKPLTGRKYVNLPLTFTPR